MDMPQSLQTIAEISIAFAGFSGLIVSRRQSSGPLTGLEKFRLQILLALAFGAMFLSFLPEILQNFADPARDIWACAAVALVMYSVGFLGWWTVASRRYARDYPEIFNWYAFMRMFTGHVAIIGLQLAALFSLLEDKGAVAYVSGLTWYLLHAAQQFARMLFVQPKKS